MQTVCRADIVTEARTWLGTPWQHQARLKGVACDCAGLVIGVARELGLLPPTFDVTGYARSPDGATLLRHCRDWLEPLEVDQVQPGDVIVLRFLEHPQHLGFAADYVHGGLSMIHCLDQPGRQRGKVVEHRLDTTWHGRIVAAFSLRGVEA